MVQPYFKDQSVPIISYSYASPIFNYIHVLQDLSIGDLKAKPPDLSYHNSPFKYSPTCHVITGD